MPQAAPGGRCSGWREQDAGCEGDETKLEVGIWGLGALQNSQGAKAELREKKRAEILLERGPRLRGFEYLYSYL